MTGTHGQELEGTWADVSSPVFEALLVLLSSCGLYILEVEWLSF